MSTHFETICPNCQRPLRVRLEYVGKRVACRHCNQAFKIPPPGEAAQPPSAAAHGPETIAAPHDDLKVVSLRRELEQARLEVEIEHSEIESLRAKLAEHEQQASLHQAERDRLGREI